MTFEYLSRVIVDETIDIDDVGNCAILANDDFANFYGIIIITTLGSTKVFEFGPVRDKGVEGIPENSYQSLTSFDYDQRKCARAIDKFLNNSHRGITQAVEKEATEVLEYVQNLTDFLSL